MTDKRTEIQTYRQVNMLRNRQIDNLIDGHIYKYIYIYIYIYIQTHRPIDTQKGIQTDRPLNWQIDRRMQIDRLTHRPTEAIDV